MKALRGGKLASFVAADWLSGRKDSTGRYEAIVSGEYRGYLEAKTWYYGQERRWPDSAFWRVRQGKA